MSYLRLFLLLEAGSTKELGNIKSRHWDLYAKPDALIGFNKKLQNVVFSIIKKILGLFVCNPVAPLESVMFVTLLLH